MFISVAMLRTLSFRCAKKYEKCVTLTRKPSLPPENTGQPYEAFHLSDVQQCSATLMKGIPSCSYCGCTCTYK